VDNILDHVDVTWLRQGMRRAFLEGGGTKGVVLAVISLIWVPVAIVVVPVLTLVRLQLTRK
jgi:hypothetical protein